MPFLFDYSTLEWTEEGPQLRGPWAERHVYVDSVEFGGSPEPARFSVDDAGTVDPTVSEQQQLISIVVPLLRDMGGASLYCRYDGGHDEAFVWLDSMTTKDGAHIPADEVMRRLWRLDLAGKVRAAGLIEPVGGPPESPESLNVASIVDNYLCQGWLSTLLGRGAGTGELTLYGAFTVDLEACTVVDDPKADPEVRNITIEEIEE